MVSLGRYDSRELAPRVVASVTLIVPLVIFIFIIVLIIFVVTRVEELLLLGGITRGKDPCATASATSLALLLGDAATGRGWLGNKV
jgi:hypothetical protein